MVAWDVETELRLMSTPPHSHHLGPQLSWQSVSPHPPRQNVGWFPLLASQLQSRILLWKALEILFPRLFTCSQIMWKALWKLLTVSSWARELVREERGGKCEKDAGVAGGPCRLALMFILHIFLSWIFPSVRGHCQAESPPSTLSVPFWSTASSLSLGNGSPLFPAPPSFFCP